MGDTKFTPGEWYNPKTDVPDFDEDVLIYYELPKDDKKDKVPHKYLEIAHVNSATEGKGYRNYEWVAKDYSPVTPLLWSPLKYPDQKTIDAATDNTVK